MATSVASSPVRSTGTGSGSPGFRSQRKLSAGTIIKKIQTLEDTIESLRQQLVFTRTEEESVPPKEVKKTKQIKEKMPAAAAAPTKQKKVQESKEEEKDKIPMPWTGQADFATCVGLKAQYGLFIQCGKACDMSSASFQIDNHECRFCNECSKKCDENGKHSVGTIEERIEAGVGKYVNAKTGKKETMYIEVLEKMKITKEEALESAARRGFQIPDWMLEKAEKKRGRPATTATSVVADKVDTGDETKPETKEKKPRQPRAKATTAKATKKAAANKVSVATNDTPQKKNSVQSSVCIDLNQEDDEDVIPVASDAVASDAAAYASTPTPQEKEKKKRGRPTKSNAQSNIGESEMQSLIVQATTEKKKRLSLDPADTCPSSQEEIGQIETCLMFESECKEEQLDDDEIFDMFDKMLEEDEKNQQQEQEQKQEVVVTAATIVEPVIVIAANEKKEKSKKAKKYDEKNSDEKVEKVEKAEKKKDDKVAKKEAAAIAKKKAEEEAAAAAKKKAEEENEETEDEEEEDDDEELECEEYEYDGETYGLAPNGDIYSQDGDLVGKLTNGAPQMFS
jgi:hypothetical protein